MRKKMYIVINKDLDMSEGKVNAHVAHAAFDYVYDLINNRYKNAEYIDEWVEADILQDVYELMKDFKTGGDTIVVLSAHNKDMDKFKEHGYTTVIDAGYTEVESGSITAVNLGIYDPDEIPKNIKRLRTYSTKPKYQSYLITGYKIMINFIIDSNIDPNAILNEYKNEYGSRVEKLVPLGSLDDLVSKVDDKIGIVKYNEVFYRNKTEDGVIYYAKEYY